MKRETFDGGWLSPWYTTNFHTDFYVAMCDLTDNEHQVNPEEIPWWNKIWDDYLRDPDDIQSLLIFSDWLEERGDLRGELIRVALEIETTSLDTHQDNLAVGEQAFQRYRLTGRYLELKLLLGYRRLQNFSPVEKDVLSTYVWLELMHAQESALVKEANNTQAFKKLFDEIGLDVPQITAGRQNAARVYTRILRRQGKGP